MTSIRTLHTLLLCTLFVPAAATAAQTRAFVVTTDFGTGSLAQISLDTRAVMCNVASIHSDARARWHDGLLYVINRFGQDNIQVIDPAQNFLTVGQFSTGAGSNPSDIAFISATKAYVTRYELADLLIVNPQNGATLGTIPLGAFADADGIPEMDRMIQVGGRVFVSLQRLDRNAGFTPADSSLIVVIDSQTNTVIDANPALAGTQGIRLTGTQPFTDFAFDKPTSRLLIGCVGFFGALDGGIEWIDPVQLKSLGYAISEAALGGDVNDLVWGGPQRSWAIVSDASFNTLLVSWTANGPALTDTLLAPGGFSLADAALNDRGEVYVAKNDFTSPGVFVFDGATGTQIAGPLGTCLPPFGIVFDSNSGAVASVRAPAGGLGLSPAWPNPAHAEVRFTVTLSSGDALEVDVFDLTGRRVRTLHAGEAAAGPHEFRWDLGGAGGARAEAGIYWISAGTGTIRSARRVVVLP
jgi:DNA-binding beta-propeller fold protein YncE